MQVADRRSMCATANCYSRVHSYPQEPRGIKTDLDSRFLMGMRRGRGLYAVEKPPALAAADFTGAIARGTFLGPVSSAAAGGQVLRSNDLGRQLSLTAPA